MISNKDALEERLSHPREKLSRYYRSQYQPRYLILTSIDSGSSMKDLTIAAILASVAPSITR